MREARKAGFEERGGEGREYEPSVQVKTVLKPQERTRASDSVREDMLGGVVAKNGSIDLWV